MVSKDRRHLFVSPYPKVRKRTFLLLSFLKPFCFVQTLKSSVADPFPECGAFLTPGSGMGKNQDPDRDEQSRSYF
jgi:hypothetical protein